MKFPCKFNVPLRWIFGHNERSNPWLSFNTDTDIVYHLEELQFLYSQYKRCECKQTNGFWTNWGTPKIIPYDPSSIYTSRWGNLLVQIKLRYHKPKTTAVFIHVLLIHERIMNRRPFYRNYKYGFQRKKLFLSFKRKRVRLAMKKVDTLQSWMISNQPKSVSNLSCLKKLIQKPAKTHEHSAKWS